MIQSERNENGQNGNPTVNDQIIRFLMLQFVDNSEVKQIDKITGQGIWSLQGILVYCGT